MKVVDSSDGSLPFVSVVVPTFCESAYISEVLEALLGQTYAKERYEVIVSDNGSTDGTRQIVEGYGVTLLSEPERSSYRARNRGIHAGRGEYFAFTDGDCVARPDWIEKLVHVALAGGYDLVGGRIENRLRSRSIGNQLFGLRTSAEERKRQVVEHSCTQGGNMLVAKGLFERVGLFNAVVSGGDSELSSRAVAAGFRIGYAEEAVVEHQCDLSSVGYLRRCFRVKYGHGANLADRPGLGLCVRRMLELPWKPGLGAAKETQALLGLRGWAGFLSVAGFMWLTRVAAYLGIVCGTWSRRFHEPG